MTEDERKIAEEAIKQLAKDMDKGGWVDFLIKANAVVAMAIRATLEKENA